MSDFDTEAAVAAYRNLVDNPGDFEPWRVEVITQLLGLVDLLDSGPWVGRCRNCGWDTGEQASEADAWAAGLVHEGACA